MYVEDKCISKQWHSVKGFGGCMCNPDTQVDLTIHMENIEWICFSYEQIFWDQFHCVMLFGITFLRHMKSTAL